MFWMFWMFWMRAENESAHKESSSDFSSSSMLLSNFHGPHLDHLDFHLLDHPEWKWIINFSSHSSSRSAYHHFTIPSAFYSSAYYFTYFKSGFPGLSGPSRMEHQFLQSSRRVHCHFLQYPPAHSIYYTCT